MKKVLIIQTTIKQYRVPFFCRLHKILLDNSIELSVAYGKPSEDEKKKGDNVTLPSEIGCETKNHWWFGQKLLFQNLLIKAIKSDLVIVEQANKHIINYILLVLSILGLKKVAYWGHGRNRQAKKYNYSEQLKKFLSNKVSWWFAYTGATEEELVDKGFPSTRITNVNNSIDTEALKVMLASIEDYEKDDFYRKINADKNNIIGLYCGSLYGEKEIPFLIESSINIKNKVPGFHLIIIGDGVLRDYTDEQCAKYDWMHYMGAKFGREKIVAFSCSDIFLNPGLVGLAVLDSFSSSLPIVTTKIGWHSPEVDYITDYENGLFTDYSVDDYASGVVSIVKDNELFNKLKLGAKRSSFQYSIENMSHSFADGVIKCLEA